MVSRPLLCLFRACHNANLRFYFSPTLHRLSQNLGNVGAIFLRPGSVSSHNLSSKVFSNPALMDYMERETNVSPYARRERFKILVLQYISLAVLNNHAAENTC